VSGGFIIAGLGPAGAMAAYLLASKGFNVTGYDLQGSYRKACGDALTIRPDYEGLVREAGVVRGVVKSYRIMLSGDELATIDFPGPNWYIIDKRGMVDYLRSLAEAEGAEIVKGPAPRPGSASSRVYVDARGPYAHLDRGDVYVMVYRGIARVDGWDPETALLDFVPGEAGLFWVFPHGEGTVNFGAGFRRRNIQYSREYSLRRLSELVSNLKVIDEAGAPIAAWSPVEPVGPGVLRIGEAAGLVNSIAGEGNRLALLSAIALAQAAGGVRDLALEYRARIRGLVSEALLSRALLSLVENSPGGEGTLRSLPAWFWRYYLEGRLDILKVIRVFVENPGLARVMLGG